MFPTKTRLMALSIESMSHRISRILRSIINNCQWVDRGYKDPETGLPSECLEWQGSTSGNPSNGKEARGHSYPRMSLDGQTVAVHRCFWVCLNGYLPGKKQLDHLFCNRKCVLHCEPVTHKENQKRRACDQKISCKLELELNLLTTK